MTDDPSSPAGPTSSGRSQISTPNRDARLPEPVSKTRVRLFGFYLIALNLALIVLLIMVWPGSIPMPEEPQPVRWLGWSIENEVRYLLIAIIAGALGSYIHLATSFSDFVGNRQLYQSWLWWYALRPFVGTALAVLLYFVALGGLLVGNAGAASVSPYGIGAISGLAGMFSKQATDKLREVFENMFTMTEHTKRQDTLDA